MTDSEDGPAPFSRSLPRACDNCRTRKVRCDKTTPCSNCRTAGVACKVTSRQNDITKPRSRVLISNQYEQKIDRMETRLENIEKLLQSLVSKSSKMPVEIEQSPTAFTPAAPVSTVAAPTPQVEQFEGESSLVAHSRQAHEALQRLLESAPMTIRNDTNTVNALASLKNVLEKHRSQAPSLNLLSQDGSLKDLTYTDLPPREEVLKLLACVAADGVSEIFTWWLFDDVEDFYQMYDEFCQSPTSCPLAISIMVYCALCWLMDSNPIMVRAGIDPSKYARYVPVCQRYLEVHVASYNLFLEPTELNIRALSAAGAYAINLADVNAAWTLTSTAARMCQSLGWHRLAAPKDGLTKEYERKATIFWSVYFLDKSLSLRLGRSSVLQDFDISISVNDVCHIWYSEGGQHSQQWLVYVKLYIEMASLQGVIYDKLYSPGSIKSLSERHNLGQELVAHIHDILERNSKCFQDQILGGFGRFYMDCNEVVLYSLLTLVYRAMPEACNAHMLSLQTSRSIMQVHNRCSKRVESMESSGLKIEYMTWTIMLCPFTPFIVLFRNVITELNLDDLKLLEDFVSSIDWLNDKDQREPLQRFQHLCQAFYNLAKHFVAARLRADNEQRAVYDAGKTLVMNSIRPVPAFDGRLNDITIPDDFQAWMDTNMDFLNNDWLAFGTL